jgi:glycerol-3-phosphate acyltransferase PlsY
VIGYLVFVPLGYLLGSIPFGYIAGKLFGGVDVREHGSGNTGTTNVARTVNLPVAIVVLVLDMGKAVAVVLLARAFTDSPGTEAVAAIATIVGHNWSVFMGFSGGKGTATGWGGLLILSPVAGLIATVVGTSAIAATRYVSLGSILASVAGAIALAVMAFMGTEHVPYAMYSAVGATFIVVKHRGNIERLVKGEERKLGHKADAVTAQPKTQRGKGLRWPRSA